MPIEVKVPILPESVADATVATWHKQPGDQVKRNENLVDIETDKVMLEVPAPDDGILEEIVKADGSTVIGEEVIALIKPQAVQINQAASKAPVSATNVAPLATEAVDLSPAVRRLVDEHQLDASRISGTGKSGRITKQDVLQHLEQADAPRAKSQAAPSTINSVQLSEMEQSGRIEKRVPMTRLRKRIAERLVQSQQTAAILTTFNEVDLKPIMDIRKRYKVTFQETHGVKLGFMSFFIKAACEALKRFPLVNASIDGEDVVYHGYFDLGVAVSTERGLVVPVIRDADRKSLAELEKSVSELGLKARNNQLTVDDLTGGNFTISNGGVFGSLLSTPIVNPPQSAILGMHKIQERPMVIDGEIVIRPMMYLALSYDHRLIDGKESVTFLITIKALLEDPTRLLLDL